jgi:hypothetical protein
MRDVLPCPIVLSLLLLITMSYWFVISFSLNDMISIMTATSVFTASTNATIAIDAPSSAYVNSYALQDEVSGQLDEAVATNNNSSDYDQNAMTEKAVTNQTIRSMVQDAYPR